MATIINNTAVSDEANLRVENPYLYIADPAKGKPLANASLYYGIPDTDPTQRGNQKKVYVVQEDNSVISISQPIMTGSGGVPLYNGSPAILAVNGDYSWRVLDSGGEQVYNASHVTNLSSLTVGSTVVEDIVTLTDGQTSVTFDDADLSISTVDVVGEDTDNGSLYRDIDYVVVDGSSGQITLNDSYPGGTRIRARQNATTAQGDNTLDSTNFYVFRTRAEAVASDLQIGDSCTIIDQETTGDNLGGDRYVTVAPGSGTNDGINFITLSNGNQLQLSAGRYRFKTFKETIGTPTITSGVLNINVDSGTVQTITLTQNVSSINFVNAGPSGTASNVTVKFIQDGTGSRSVNFTGIKFPGGIAPTLTTTANAEDNIVFVTFNGTQWEGYPSLDVKV